MKTGEWLDIVETITNGGNIMVWGTLWRGAHGGCICWHRIELEKDATHHVFADGISRVKCW